MVSLNWYQKQELEVAKWQWRRGCTRNIRDKNFFCWVELGTAQELVCVKIPCKKRLGGSRMALLWENSAVACKSNCLEWWLGQCLKSLLWRTAAARHQKRTWVQKGTSTTMAGTDAPLLCSWFSTKDCQDGGWGERGNGSSGLVSIPPLLSCSFSWRFHPCRYLGSLQYRWCLIQQHPSVLWHDGHAVMDMLWWACPAAREGQGLPAQPLHWQGSFPGGFLFFGECAVSAAAELSQESLWDKGNTRSVFEVGKAEPSVVKRVIKVKWFFFSLMDSTWLQQDPAETPDSPL